MKENKQFKLVFNSKLTNFNMSHVKKFILKLFKLNETDVIHLTIEKREIFFTINDIYDNAIVKTKTPFNIKNHSRLGHYDETYKLLITYNRGNEFRLTVGSGTNKPIRKLYILDDV